MLLYTTKGEIFMIYDEKTDDELYLLDAYITPCLGVIRDKERHEDDKEERQKDIVQPHPLTQEDIKKIAIRRSNVKRKQTLVLKETESMSLDDEMLLKYAHLSRAIQTHLLYFSSIADTCLAHGWRVSYLEFKKRIKRQDLKKEQKAIKRWVQTHAKDTMTAVSIGYGKKGYMYVYYISTGKNTLKILDTGTDFIKYMRKTRKAYPRIIKPYEKDPQEFLNNKYCMEVTIDRVFTTPLSEECYYMLRSGLVLSGLQKTIRTTKARHNLQQYKRTIPIEKIHCTHRGWEVYRQIRTFVVHEVDDEMWTEDFDPDKEDIQDF